MNKKRRNHSPEFKSKVAFTEQGYEAGRKHVQRLMRRMGMQAIHPGPKTSKPNPQHKLYPYLWRDLKINRTNQGSQYTGEAFTNVLKGLNINISSDGKGAWRDNTFVERLWRSVNESIRLPKAV